MSDNLNFRIHPAIGIARVGNSPEYYLGPETAAGDTVTWDSVKKQTSPVIPSGGLPIKPGTETDTISSNDLRDSSGAFKRQAARFKIYQYKTPSGNETYPLGPDACLQEIKIGSTINGKIVSDIIWTVHLANKKAAGYFADDANGVKAYEGKLPPLRNKDFPVPNAAADNQTRLQALVIDPGPRTISGKNTQAVACDKTTEASYFDGQKVTPIDNYPKTFPGNYFKDLLEPQGSIDTLGEIQTDAYGRLVVTGGYGRSAGWDKDSDYKLYDAVNNDGWFDDASDGPVSAVIILEDSTQLPVQGGAWVCATDPGIAPQIKNVVSLWEDIYDAWVRNLRLVPDLFDGTSFNSNYKPGFYNQLSGVFEGAELQQWIANLPNDPHAGVGKITPASAPSKYYFNVLRNPNIESQFNMFAPDGNPSPYMPLALGDSGVSFLSVTKTQYFFLSQWVNGKFNTNNPVLGPGEFLDQNVLLNCLGGRFSPGIDLTYIVRLMDLYVDKWETSEMGPFRIKAQPLDYDSITEGQVFLTEGYVPLHTTTGVQPGDVLKMMAIPWHTDYNSCANHPPQINPTYPTTPPPTSVPYNEYTFWSWPAQRPVVVFPSKKEYASQSTPPTEQWFSVRGPGTETNVAKDVGRYQVIKDILINWQKVGVVMQDTSDAANSIYYLEYESKFPDGEQVPPWPKYLPDET